MQHIYFEVTEENKKTFIEKLKTFFNKCLSKIKGINLRR